MCKFLSAANRVSARQTHTRPLIPGVVTGARHRLLPLRRASFSHTLKCSCAILPPGLVFENVRSAVGCVARLTLNPGEMSIAVEHERSLLTANKSRNSILKQDSFSLKLNPRLSGGIS